MHLLRTETVTLDQTAEAVDLDLSPADILFLSFTDSDLTGLMAAHDARNDDRPSLRSASLKTLGHPFSVDLLIEKTATKARFILVRLLGGKDYWSYGVDELARLARDKTIALAIIPGDYRADQRLTEASTLDADALETLWRCFHESGQDNFSRALDHIHAHLDHRIKPHAPVKQPPVISFAPATRNDHIEAPYALLLAYRSIIVAEDTAPLIALAVTLSQKGINCECLAVSSLKDPDAMAALENHLDQRKPDIILNTTAFSARRDDGTTVLDRYHVPVLQVILATTREEPWHDSTRGLNAADLAMNIVLPELDGRLVTRAISFKAEDDTHKTKDFTRIIHRPKPDRINFVADLAKNWIALSRVPAKEKRLAFILSDYPHKGGHQAYAVGLDTPASLVAMFEDLKQNGYRCDLNEDSAAIMRALTEEAAVELMTADDYRALFTTLPASFRQSVEMNWGEPPQKSFSFRIIKTESMIVALQPLRSRADNQKDDYHDPTRPPAHDYIAFYLWLTRYYRPHALIHCGTHGTLEWLPGKSVALSSTCAPEILLGPLPVIYPFIVNNPGEAAQAKRRLSALTLGHLTPPLVEAGTYGEMAEIESLLDEYSTAQSLDPRRAEQLATLILERATETGLDRDAGFADERDRDEQLAALDRFLCDVKEMRIADGLHIFGRGPHGPSHDEWIDTVFGEHDRHAIRSRLAASPAHERNALIEALNGRFIPPGPAGAPTKGRLDILPTGRNLFTIDPRSIPTRTAWDIGRRTADDLVMRYLQDHGDMPRAIVIDLWGSASMRTGGDDLAQAFALLGVRPLWDQASSRVSGFEILPPAVFGRSRIDVTLRISGLFRDVFPQQIALFDEAVQAVAMLDETDDENPLAAQRRKSDETQFRIFGSAPGTFGLGVNDLIQSQMFDDRTTLGEAYLAANSHAYRASGDAIHAEDAFRAQVKAADAFVHVQDTDGQDLLDSDAFAEHEGGFAAAAAQLGANVSLYHIDARRGDQPAKVRTLREELIRVLKARATNPRWIKGQMRHGFRGATEIAETLRNLYSFAALTDAAESRDFDAYFTATLGNDEVRQFLTFSNPQAAMSMAALFREAERRGYWTTRRNSTGAVLDELLVEATS